MQKALICILILLYPSLQAGAAVLLDGSAQCVSLASDPAIDFADGDWTIAGWVSVLDNSGTASCRFVNMDNGAGHLSIALNEVSSADPPNEMWIELLDDGGLDEIFLETNTDPFASNTNWTHIALVRTGTGSACTITLYINGSTAAAGTNNAVDAVAAATLYFGNRASLTRGLNGSMAEWAKWSRALSPNEIGALKSGFAPAFFPKSLMFYVPMIRDNNEIKQGISVTNTGTAGAGHPRITYPN